MKKLLFIILIFVAIIANGADYYIDADAGGSGVGTIGDPWNFAQLNAATKVGGNTYYLQRGDTFEGVIILTQSGTSGNPITYSAYGTGADPIITGFETITGWTSEGGGIYSKVITSDAQTNMVTIDGVQYGMGRYPNTGFLSYESSGTNSITDNQLTGTPDWTGAEAVIEKNPYKIDRCLITNQSTTVLTYDNLGSPDSAIVADYFFQNDLQTLDSFGEWYHDYSTGKFSMYFGGLAPSSYTVNVATENNIIYSNSKSYVTFENLEISGSISNAIYLVLGTEIDFNSCDIKFTGLDGIRTSSATNLSIDSCSFTDINRNGVYNNGVNLVVTNSTFTNINYIIGQGDISNTANAIYCNADNPLVQGNNIYNTGTHGIFYQPAALTGLIKNNYIENTCILLTDVGAIYTAGAHTYLVIDGNIIVGGGGDGIYLDEQCDNTTLKNNTVSGCDGNGIKFNKAREDSVYNNTIFDCGGQLYMQSWREYPNLFDLVITGNKFFAKTGQYTLQYNTGDSGDATNMATNTFDNNYYARPIDDNLTIQVNTPALSSTVNLTGWQSFSSQDANSTISPYTITSESELDLKYNATSTAAAVPITGTWKDLDGTVYTTSVTLQPYTSIVLFETTVPARRLIYDEKNGYYVNYRR